MFYLFTFSVTPDPDNPGLTYAKRFIPRIEYKKRSKKRRPPILISAGRLMIIVLRITLRLAIFFTSLRILMILSSKNTEVTVVTELRTL